MKNLKKLLAYIFLFSLLLSACATKQDPTARFAVTIDPYTESAVICVYHNHILLRFVPNGGYVKVDEVYVRVPGINGEKFVVADDRGNIYSTELFSAIPSDTGYTVTGDSHSSVDFLDNITKEMDGKCYAVGPNTGKYK